MLWLSAALAAISLSVAMTVRGETERVATSQEDERAYYLAQSAVQRAILYVEWSQSGRLQDGIAPYFVPGQPRMNFNFPTGIASVEVIPEASKLSLSRGRPEVLEALLLNLGVNPDRAAVITAGIVGRRTPASNPPSAGPAQPSFPAVSASFQNVEDLLSIPGMTADLFYGTWVRRGDGDQSRLVPVEGLRDCVSVFGSVDRFDVNSVRPPVLAAVGVPPEFIQALLSQRQVAPFLRSQALTDFAGSDPTLLNHVGIGPHTLYTFRATARMRRPDGSFSDLKRVVSAMVKFLGPSAVGPDTFHVLRWYDRG